MILKLITQGTPKEQVIQVARARTVIGRQEGCALRVPSGEVSRRHCVLACEDGNVTIEDLGSCNGTFLNGKRLTSKRLVHSGDTVQVGPITFTVEYSLADTNVQGPSTPPAAKVPSSDAGDGEDVRATRHAASETRTDPAHSALSEEDDVVEAVVAEEDDIVEAKLADEEASKPWNVPQDEELRDILTQLEE